MLQKMLKLHGTSKLTRNQQMNILGGGKHGCGPDPYYVENTCGGHCNASSQSCGAIYDANDGSICGYTCVDRTGDF